MTTHIASIRDLTDDALIARTKTLVRAERQATAALVEHLAEMDARRLFLAEGCSSIFTYCTQVLRLSEFAAYTRIAAARAGRRFPLVFEYLARGDVHLSAVDRLAPHLTEENHRDLLDRARHRSKRDVEKLVAEIAPKPPAVTLVRRLPAQRSAATQPTGSELLHVAADNEASHGPSATPAAELSIFHSENTNNASTAGEPAPLPAAARSTGKPTRVTQLAPEHYRVQFTADPETIELLRRAQDLLRHQIPNGDPAVVFKMALGDLVRRLEKTKIARVERPRAPKVSTADTRPVAGATGSTSGAQVACPETVRSVKGDAAASPRRDSRRIPSAVRRAVWERDEARCAFRTRDGRRCAETGHLEFHHVTPYARGGRATVSNIELRCRAHNGYEATLDFGQHPASFVRERPINWFRDQFSGSYDYVNSSDGLRQGGDWNVEWLLKSPGCPRILQNDRPGEANYSSCHWR